MSEFKDLDLCDIDRHQAPIHEAVRQGINTMSLTKRGI